jgi:hypothetical protein
MTQIIDCRIQTQFDWVEIIARSRPTKAEALAGKTPVQD